MAVLQSVSEKKDTTNAIFRLPMPWNRAQTVITHYQYALMCLSVVLVAAGERHDNESNERSAVDG